ncbi:MAG: helix-turn-helix domain-containing protein [Clostridia bacterium]|nr:helix-turn-helix domain-containing protein [Clostridia bacterium]
MDFRLLNPVVRSADVYEKVINQGFCRCYDARLIYVISGDLAFQGENDKKPQHLGPGNLLYIPAGEIYKLKAKFIRAAVFTFDLTAENPDPTEPISPVAAEHFDASLLHKTKDSAPFDKTILLEDAEADRDFFINMTNLAISGEGEWRAHVSAQLKLALLKLAETKSENALPTRMVENLDSYIRENYKDEISNTEIGAIFGYHPFYVSRMLKEKKGITLRQYIISYRFKAARKMLMLTDKSIAEIAEENGFTDASYFAKSFKATFGITPKEYRNSFKDSFI